MVIFSAKLTNNINLVKCVLKDKFFLNRKKGLIILVILHKTHFPVFVIKSVYNAILDSFESAFAIKLGNKLVESYSFIEINFADGDFIFSQLNVVFDLALLYIEKHVIVLLLFGAENYLFLKIPRFDYFLARYLK